ncbi:unnamed protein product [Phytophthora lilii]|uniref:Unnamed protein product n=1 Tax=Phytophthora lilii TaxID=2077276 RepID=A0A9W6XBN9_9STRA|nr:unnamed protein product [Phytophthora lilii]
MSITVQQTLHSLDISQHDNKCMSYLESNVGPLSQPATPPQTDHEREPRYERLTNIPFPTRIRALHHVMKNIDTLLMSPEEALTVAARSGHFEWMQSLVARFEYNKFGSQGQHALETALQAGVSSGNLAVVKQIVGIMDRQTFKDDRIRHACLRSAACNGHIDTLKYLLVCNYEHLYYLLKSVFIWTVESGRLDAVEFLVGYIRANWKSIKQDASSTLAYAIRAGHSGIAEYLLGLNDFRWDLIKALKVAVCAGNANIAKKIYEVYPRLNEGKNLFVELAASSNLRGLKYLHDNGLHDPEVFDKHLRELPNLFT